MTRKRDMSGWLPTRASGPACAGAPWMRSRLHRVITCCVGMGLVAFFGCNRSGNVEANLRRAPEEGGAAAMPESSPVAQTDSTPAVQTDSVVIPGLPRFRARFIHMDPDTVWFTATSRCPEYAVAFVRRTGSWVRATRRECPVDEPNPETERRGSVSGSPRVALTRGIRLDLLNAAPGDTGKVYYALRVPGDSTVYPLLVPDSISTWALSTWPRDEYDDVLPFSEHIMSWLDDGQFLYFGLDGVFVNECPLTGACSEPAGGHTGGLLRFDPDARVVDAIVDRSLQKESVRKMFVAGGDLWLFTFREPFKGYSFDDTEAAYRPARDYSVYRYDARQRTFTAVVDSTAGSIWGKPYAAEGIADTLWIAAGQTVALFSVRDNQWARRFYGDSLGLLPDGADTVYTFLTSERPVPRDTVPGVCPVWGGANPEQVRQFLVCHFRLRRRTAFLTAAAQLPDSILEAIGNECAPYSQAYDIDLSLWDCPAFDRRTGVREPLAAFLADSSLSPFLREALPLATQNGYRVALRALTLLGADQARDAARAMLESGQRTSRTIRDLLALDDSTGVFWLRQAVTTAAPEQAARMAGLVQAVRDPESVAPLIGMIRTAGTAARDVVTALVSLTGVDSAPPYGFGTVEAHARLEAFWREWWEQNGEGFVPVSEELGRQAVAEWRLRRVP